MNKTLAHVAASRTAARQAAADKTERAINAAWKTYATAVSGGSVPEKELAAAVELLSIPPEQIADDVDAVKSAVENQHMMDQLPAFQAHMRAARLAWQQADEAADMARRNWSATRCRVGAFPAWGNRINELHRNRERLFRELDLSSLATRLPATPPAVAKRPVRTLVDWGRQGLRQASAETAGEPEIDPPSVAREDAVAMDAKPQDAALPEMAPPPRESIAPGEVGLPMR